MSLAMTDSEQRTVRVRVIREPEQFIALRSEWNKLYSEACNPAPPLHHDWLRLWLEVYGDRYLADRDGLRVICCRQDGRLVGALPLYQRRGLRLGDGGEHLRFISTGEQEKHEICPDYMDMLCLERTREACVEVAWRTICGTLGRSYDRVELSNVADCSALVRWARAHGPDEDLEISPAGVCPIADLSGGFEAYLGRLSANTRQQARRLLRAAGGAGVVFEVASTASEREVFFKEMVALHQKRWTAAGEPGCFASVPFTAFHRRLLGEWGPRGGAVISRLRLGGQVLAVKYGFRTGCKYDFYQSGVMMDENAPVKSPGIVSFLLLMQYLAGEGVTAFDFLRGSSHYKQRLATTAQPLVEIRRVQWTLRTTMGFVAVLGAKSMRRMSSLLKQRRLGASPSRE